jgi:hypothetical protein
MFARAKDQVLCRGFLIASFVQGAGIHARLRRQIGNVQIELQRWFQERQGVAEHWVRIQVETGRKGKKCPHQQPIFVEKIGFVAM